MPRAAVLVLTLVLAALAAPAPVGAQEATPAAESVVLAPDATVGGIGRGEWSARYWQWILGIPSAVSPYYDETGERCGLGQHGPVFFLADAPASVERRCAVPAGAVLFVPVGGAECSTAEAPPWFGRDEAELRACAKAAVDSAERDLDMTTQAVMVDGRSAGDLSAYRVATPPFRLVLPPGNDLGVPAGVALAAADG